MNDVSTRKWGKAASDGVYVCVICNMWVEHGSDDCPHSNTSREAVLPAMQRATIEVPNNVNQAQVLVTRMFEGLQADVARNHEFVATMVASLENRIMEQQRYGEQLARIEAQLAALRADADKGRETQQLIMQKLETNHQSLLCKMNILELTLVNFGIDFARPAPKKRQPKRVQKVTKR